ncbi:MAG: phospholipase D family protein [Bradyrhizobium sp.]|nr:phospholipase D family protein [Bradyrhizobium sp.]
MKLITTARQLDVAFRQLLDQYKKVSFAVAWASHGFSGYAQLVKHQKKIGQGIVGTHFYQTHPAFIDKFMGDERVRFVKQTDGTFHPKFYLFHNSKDDWSCLLGSANFTRAAFNTNSEACMLFNSTDDNDSSIRDGLNKAINEYWDMGDCFEEDELDEYKRLWYLFRQRTRSIAGDFGDKKQSKPVLKTPLLSMSWAEYLKAVRRDKPRHINERTEVLDAARRLFRDHGRFARMPPLDRKGIAGFNKSDDVPWGWFGSMSGNGTFMNRVNANDPNLSRALDAIPLNGEVGKEHYNEFVEAYLRAFPEGRHGLPTATRLLAMKRPDYFVCFDSANRRKLCTAFEISLHHHDYDRYWDSLIERILISKWWNSPRPNTEREAKLWDGRAAFLDCLYYEAI